MEDKKVKIIITDDSSVFVEALEVMLASVSDLEVIDTCSNGLELIESKKLAEADLLLIDIEMPIMNGFEAAQQINCKGSNIPMIALTMHQDKVYLIDIIKSGFRGFIHKSTIGNSILEVIEKVLNNSYVFPKDLRIQ